MHCDDVSALLDAYVDHELDVAHDLAIAAHLQTCQRCTRLYEDRLALQTALRTKGTYFVPTPSLQARLRTALRRAVPPSFLRSPWTALAALGLLVFVLTSAFVWFRWSRSMPTDERVREVITAHVHSLQVDHLTDVASTEPHTLKPWFSDKLSFAPPVVDLTPHGFQLVGARLDYLDERPVAAVVYRRRQHRINLWMAPTASPPAVATSPVTRRGYHVLHWISAGMAYWAVSDLNQEELGLFQHLLQRHGCVGEC